MASRPDELGGNAITIEHRCSGIPAQHLTQQIVIGSGPGVDIALDGDPQVSARHARLTPVGALAALEDLASTNGTFVRLDPDRRAPIRDRQRFQLGSATLRFVAGAARARSRPRFGPDGVELGGSALPRGGAYLVEILPAGRAGDRRHLVPGVNWLGRSGGATIPIAGDPGISRVHARLDLDERDATLADWGTDGRGSTGGTWIEIVGDAPIALAHGAAFRIGSHEFVVNLGAWMGKYPG